MAAKRRAAKKSATAAEPMAVEPTPTAASREKDREEKVPTFRVDLGESVPTAPIRTATDSE